MYRGFPGKRYPAKKRIKYSFGKDEFQHGIRNRRQNGRFQIFRFLTNAKEAWCGVVFAKPSNCKFIFFRQPHVKWRRNPYGFADEKGALPRFPWRKWAQPDELVALIFCCSPGRFPILTVWAPFVLSHTPTPTPHFLWTRRSRGRKRG